MHKKVCPNCGAEGEQSAQFCKKCGSALVAEKMEEPFHMRQSVKTKTNWLAIACSMLMIICVFLPYLTVSTYGISSVQTLIDGGDGYFFLLLAIISIIFGLKGYDTGILVVGVIVCSLAVVEVYDASTYINETEFGTLIERGNGFYALLVSSIGLLISGCYRKIID